MHLFTRFFAAFRTGRGSRRRPWARLSMTLVVVPVVSAVILTGGATPASATTCGDSWTNSSGGSWSAGGNWSSGQAPTSAQSACVVIATSAPITESGTVTAAGLTLGGTSGQTVLELAGTVRDSASSTISADGELTDDLGSNLDMTHGATLTNDGTVLVAGGQTLTLTGKVTNAAGGVVDVAAVGGYGGVLYLNGPGTFTNDGTLSAQTNASIDAPGNGTGPSVAPIVFYDEGGTFTNDGTVTISAGGMFKQRSTAISGTGAPIDVDGAVLDFTGSGGGTFTAYGTTELDGNMAHGQSVTLDSSQVTAAGSWDHPRSIHPGGSAHWLLGQVPGQAVDHLGGAFLAQGRCLQSVDAVQVGALLGPGQRRAVAALGELDGGDRHRDPGVVGVHLVAVHDPLVRHDVVVQRVVPVARALPLVAEPLPAARPEVELLDACLVLRGLQPAGVAPGVFGLGRRKGGEHPGWGGRVGPLDRERVVDDGTIGHWCSSLSLVSSLGSASQPVSG